MKITVVNEEDLNWTKTFPVLVKQRIGEEVGEDYAVLLMTALCGSMNFDAIVIDKGDTNWLIGESVNDLPIGDYELFHGEITLSNS